MTTTSRPAAGVSPEEPTPRKSALSALLNSKPWDAKSVSPSVDELPVDELSLVDVPDTVEGIDQTSYRLPQQSAASDLGTQKLQASATQNPAFGTIDCEWSEATESVAASLPAKSAAAAPGLAQSAILQANSGEAVENDYSATDAGQPEMTPAFSSPADSLAAQIEQDTKLASLAGPTTVYQQDSQPARGAAAGHPHVTAPAGAVPIAFADEACDSDALSRNAEPLVPPVSVAAKPSAHTRVYNPRFDDSLTDKPIHEADSQALATASRKSKRRSFGQVFSGLFGKTDQLEKPTERQRPLVAVAEDSDDEMTSTATPETISFTTKHEYRRTAVAPIPVQASDEQLSVASLDDDHDTRHVAPLVMAEDDTIPMLSTGQQTSGIGAYVAYETDTRPISIVVPAVEYERDADTQSLENQAGVAPSPQFDVHVTAEDSDAATVAMSWPTGDDCFEDIGSDSGYSTVSAAVDDTVQGTAPLVAEDVHYDDETSPVMALPDLPEQEDAEETQVFVPLVSGPVAKARTSASTSAVQLEISEDPYWPQSDEFGAADTTSQLSEPSVESTTDRQPGDAETESAAYAESVAADTKLAPAKPALVTPAGTEGQVAADNRDAQSSVAHDESASVDVTPRPVAARRVLNATPLPALFTAVPEVPAQDLDASQAVEPDTHALAAHGADAPSAAETTAAQTSQGEPVLAGIVGHSAKPTETDPAKSAVSQLPESVESATLPAETPLVLDGPISRLGERLDAEADESTEDSVAFPLVGHAAILASRDRRVGAPWLPYDKLQKAPVFAPTRRMTETDDSWHDQVAELAHTLPKAYVASYWDPQSGNGILPSDQALVVVRPEAVADVLHAYPLLQVASVESVTFADSCQLTFEVMRILGRDKGARWEVTSMDAYTGAVRGTVYVPTGRVFNEAHRLRVLNEFRTKRQHRWPTAVQDITFNIDLVRTPKPPK